MERKSRARPQSDLLVRPPCSTRDLRAGWSSHFLDPVGQLDALADLWARGLLSREEFEREKAKVLAPWPAPQDDRRPDPGLD